MMQADPGPSLAALLQRLAGARDGEVLASRALAAGLETMAGRETAWTLAYRSARRDDPATARLLVAALGDPGPQDPWLALALAQTMMAAAEGPLAARLAAAALDAAATDGTGHHGQLVAKAYRVLGEAAGLAAALARCRADAAAWPCSPSHALGRARFLTHARHHAAALLAHGESRRMLPDDRDRAVEYAEAALRAAPPDAAVAAIIESLAQWPDDPVLLLLASRAFKQVGQFEQAIQAGLAALRADPPPRGVHAHLLALLVRAASYEAALGVAERAMDLALPPGEIGPIGLLLRSVPPDDRARDLARRFLRAHPNHRDVPEIARIAGRRPELSAVPVERTRLVDGRPPPGEVFEAFLGKGHLLHSGKRPQAPARDVDLLDLRDVTLNIFPYGFAITDRDGLPLDVGNPSIHADLVAFLDSLPVQDPVDEIFYAADGKWAANNYCHWLLDYLPRILWAERLRPGLPIAVSGMDIGGFRAASLAAIGFDRRRLTVLDAGRYPVARLAVLSNSDHRFFRNALHGGNADYAAPLLDAFPAPSAEPHRHIFLTRPPGNGRTFTNYDDAMAVVRGQGFEVVDPGRHAFAAQVGMMREAVAVAGPHGAGLTNILFCPPGTKVLEIFPRDAGTLPFAMLSAVKGHRYRALIGAGQGMTSIPGLDGNRANFPIDLTELGQALGALRAEAAATR